MRLKQARNLSPPSSAAAKMLNPKVTSMLLLVTAGTQRDQVVQYIVAEFASLHEVMYV